MSTSAFSRSMRAISAAWAWGSGVVGEKSKPGVLGGGEDADVDADAGDNVLVFEVANGEEVEDPGVKSTRSLPVSISTKGRKTATSWRRSLIHCAPSGNRAMRANTNHPSLRTTGHLV